MRLFAELGNVMLVEDSDKNDKANAHQSNWRSIQFICYLFGIVSEVFSLENDWWGENHLDQSYLFEFKP